ncbi:hypothetical protein BH11PSE2_BH11PSE2_19830 [soil metagenome]
MLKRLPLSAPCAAVLLLCATIPAYGQVYRPTPQQDAEAKTNALEAEGREFYRQAEAQEASGDFSSACRNFKNAAADWFNANLATVGMLTEIGPNQQYDKDVVIRNGRELGKNSNLADARAKAVCGKTNAPSSAGSASSARSSGGSSNTGSYTSYFPPEFDFFGAMTVLQAKLDKGYGFATDASTRYQAGNFQVACESARQSANLYSQAVADARTILDGRFADTSTIDISHIETNARQSAADASEFYCQGKAQ